VVPIFTYRDERKLFALIGGGIIAALIVFLQVTSARTGKPNPITITISTLVAVGQICISSTTSVMSATVAGVIAIPRLWHDNAELTQRNHDLSNENIRLREELSSLNNERKIEHVNIAYPHGVIADTIGYDPENQSRVITIDHGSLSAISPDDGVINDEGIVGRVIHVTPFASTVLLITDPSSKVPAVVERGRWWGIATGTNGRVQLQYISQDAPLHIGDMVVTGRGLSFQAGLPIGRIAKVYHSEGALYQTALIHTATSFGRLDHVLVMRK
jgi:rod shape-determining protein MreC